MINHNIDDPTQGYFTGLMHACGYRGEDLRKPVIGIVNSCTDVNPGHMPLGNLAQRVKEFERREALKAVERHGSTTQGKRAAAAELGISLASLYNKLGSS